jgi:hypothetical protein
MFPAQYEDLQIMSHAVIGFPSLEENEKAIAGLAEAGVKLIEPATKRLSTAARCRQRLTLQRPSAHVTER